MLINLIVVILNISITLVNSLSSIIKPINSFNIANLTNNGNYNH